MKQSIDHYFRQRTDEDLFAGVVRMTQGDEEVFSAAYGMANRTWTIPAALSTRFDTASLTKLFTAVLTLQLIDAGEFSLETPVIPYLELEGTSISPAVTVYQLLTHSSGIGDDAEEEAGEEYADLWKAKPNYSVSEAIHFLPQFAYKPPNFPPGEGCRYCNCGYILLGLMIEKALDRSYRDMVQERIFVPAGMTDSGFFHKEWIVERIAQGSDPVRNDAGAVVGWKTNIYAFPPIGTPDSGAFVTAADLDRFLRAVRRGLLLSEQMTREFFTPQIHYQDRDGWTMKYGLGMWFYVQPDGQVVCCQKEGYNAGVSAVMRYFFDCDVNLVILSNMASGAWDPAWKVHELITSQVNSPDR